MKIESSIMIRLTLPQKLETERLTLERLKYEDAEEIFFTYASKPEATKYMSFPTHQSIHDARSFLRYARSAWDQGTEYAFSIREKDTHRFIGSIGVINENGKVHFGYCISPAHWGRGFATEACSVLLTVLRNQKDVYRIWTFTDAENKASGNVLIKCGLIEEARLKDWFRFVNQDNQPKDCILYILKE